MSMRETLREAARVISIVVEQAAQLERKDPEPNGLALSAALRALADRWDAVIRENEDGDPSNRCDCLARSLARLDAPVTPGEPGATCGTCGGAKVIGCGCGSAYCEQPTSHPCPDCAEPKLSRDHYILEALKEMSAEQQAPTEPAERMTAADWRRYTANLADASPTSDCTPSPPRSPEAPRPAEWKDDQTVGQVLTGVAARSPEAKPPKCECDAHDKTSCTRSADYLVTRAGKRLAVCDRCTLTGDGIDDRDLNPDWSQHRPAGSPEAKACEAWCGNVTAELHGDCCPDAGYWQRGVDNVLRGFCSKPCHDAGRALNPRTAK